MTEIELYLSEVEAIKKLTRYFAGQFILPEELERHIAALKHLAERLTA